MRVEAEVVDFVIARQALTHVAGRTGKCVGDPSRNPFRLSSGLCFDGPTCSTPRDSLWIRASSLIGVTSAGSPPESIGVGMSGDAGLRRVALLARGPTRCGVEAGSPPGVEYSWITFAVRGSERDDQT